MEPKPKTLTEDEKAGYETQVQQAIYQATVRLFEKLEIERHITGNGHHMAQKLAVAGQDLLRERWVK